jgi:hypothetical protein
MVNGNTKESTIDVDGQKFYSISALAKKANVSASYIRAEIGRKKIPAYKDQRGWLFVAETEADKFIARRERKFEPVP